MTTDIDLLRSGIPAIPSNPMELKGFCSKIEVGIDLAKKALRQPNLEPEKYKEILRYGQAWAEAKLNTELKIKEFINTTPKKSKWDKDQPDTSIQLIKGKVKVIQLLCLTERQSKEIMKLTPDGIKQAIEQSKTDGDIPTRYSAIRLSKSPRPDKTTDRAPYHANKLSITIKTTNGDEFLDDIFVSSQDKLSDLFAQLKFNSNTIIKPYRVIEAPFPYPGSKRSSIDFIYPYLRNQKKVISPFLGAGSLELNLANRGIEVVGYDYNSDISCFWEQLIKHRDELLINIDVLAKQYRVLSFEDYSKVYKGYHQEYFYRTTFKKNKDKMIDDRYKDKTKQAAVYWLLRKTCFRGVIDNLSCEDNFAPLLGSNTINRLRDYDFSKFKFGGHYSFEKSIAKHSNDFLYCDPPFYNANLYGTKARPETQEEFNHESLAQILNSRKDWILSYNDCSEIQKLYKGHKIIKLNLLYSISAQEGGGHKIGKEILIFG
jgi:DNA adenine methylase